MNIKEGGAIMAKSMKGKFDRTLDPKGRMIVPAQLRDALGTDFVVTVGLDKCLYLYSTNCDLWN